MCSPKKNDGTYKIDPNLGCDDDAFKADCVKNTKCTCMGCDFVRDISAVQTWTAPRNLLNVTFSRVTNGFELDCTNIKRSQLNFLRLLSSTATQVIKYHGDASPDVNFKLANGAKVPASAITIADKGSYTEYKIAALPEHLPVKDVFLPSSPANSWTFGLKCSSICFCDPEE